METEMIGKTYDKVVGEAAERHFSHLVPVRDGREQLFAHLFRDVYPCLAVFYFAPDKDRHGGTAVSDIAYLPVILGHYWVKSGEERRNYQSSLRYLAYRISDAEVYKHKGKRQGVRLGEPGVEILEEFRPKPVVVDGPKKKEQKVDLLETKKRHSATQLSQETKARLDQVQKELGVRTQDEAMSAALDSLYALRQVVSLVQPLYERLETDDPVGAVQALLGDGGAIRVDEKLGEQFKTSLTEVVGLLDDARQESAEPVKYLRDLLGAKRIFKKSYEKRGQGKDYTQMATSVLRRTKKPGATQERFRRAVDTLLKHNDTVAVPEFRRYVSPAFIIGLVGGRSDEAKAYIETRGAEIAAHHEKYGLDIRVNRVPLQSVKIEVPEWPEGGAIGS
jgi:hypothetical protein